jgi:hypothetical protein
MPTETQAELGQVRPCGLATPYRPASARDAMRAPAARSSSFAHTISGWLTLPARPQSVPAITFSAPTSRA